MKIYIFTFFLVFSFSLGAQISNDGLLAYYTFDNDVLDYGPNNFNGVMNGGSFSEDAQGNPISALYLNGTDEFIDLSLFADSFRENLNQMSIFFNVKFEKQEDQQTILSLGNDGENLQTNVFEIEYEHNRFQIESETGDSAINHELEIDQTESLFTNEWHQILITINGDSLSYCRDGELIFQDTFTPTETLSNNLFLGNFGGTNQNACCFFGGFIDDLQFYNRILDKEEISVNTSEMSYQMNPLIFPNPTQQKLFIQLEKHYQSIFIILSDATGRKILTKEFNNLNHFNLDLPDQSGLYFLKLINQNSEIKTFKILKY